jgi:hypothetical protein
MNGMSELQIMVRNVADRLNAIGAGENPYADPSYGYEWGEDGRTCDGSDMGPMDVFMLDEVLDLKFIVDSHAEYCGALIYVTLGGPTIWVDTRAYAVKGTWGTESAEWGITGDIAFELDVECGANWESIRRSY